MLVILQILVLINAIQQKVVISLLLHIKDFIEFITITDVHQEQKNLCDRYDELIRRYASIHLGLRYWIIILWSTNVIRSTFYVFYV